MNVRNGSLVVVVLVSLVIGGVIGKLLWPKPWPGPSPSPSASPSPSSTPQLLDPPAKYVLIFGDTNHPEQRVSVLDMNEFEKALGAHGSGAPPPNWNELFKRESDNGNINKVETVEPSPAGSGTVTISHMSVTQEITVAGQPCTLHVTQRVGLNNIQQVKDVLAKLSLNKGP